MNTDTFARYADSTGLQHRQADLVPHTQPALTSPTTTRQPVISATQYCQPLSLSRSVLLALGCPLLLGGNLHAPGQASSLEKPDAAVEGIKLPPRQPSSSRPLEGVVVVVPALSTIKQSDDPVVGAEITCTQDTGADLLGALQQAG